MLSVVKMLLKGEVGGRALISHGNYIVDHGKSWKNHGIVFLNLCWNPGVYHVVSFVIETHRSRTDTVDRGYCYTQKEARRLLLEVAATHRSKKTVVRGRCYTQKQEDCC